MRGCETAFCYFTRSIKLIGAINAARVCVLRRADKTGLPENIIRADVKTARGISHAIAVAK
jgi:hypothetical protein